MIFVFICIIKRCYNLEHNVRFPCGDKNLFIHLANKLLLNVFFQALEILWWSLIQFLKELKEEEN